MTNRRVENKIFQNNMSKNASIIVAYLLATAVYRSSGSEATGSLVEDEDHLETEIDIREPRSFPGAKWETLTTRHNGFRELHCNHDGVPSQQYVANWEVFASNYWYETRTTNCTCPVVPKGIAAQCDWAMMVPCLFGNATKEPKLVFVDTMMLPHFAESTLRFIPNHWRFILISAGHDRTIPLSAGDRRFQPLRGMWMGPNWHRIIEAQQVVHWYAENRDFIHPKFSTLPTASCDELNPDDRTDFPPADSVLPLEKRPLVVMSLDRQRPGPQFADRAAVDVMCKNSSICLQPNQDFTNIMGISRKSYLAHVASVPFIACVHGGGLDPSPKAWEALIIGTIPIIQHSTVEDAYHHFPVAFVDNWSDLFEDEVRGKAMLEQWMKELAPFYEPGSHLRQRTLNVSHPLQQSNNHAPHSQLLTPRDPLLVLLPHLVATLLVSLFLAFTPQLSSTAPAAEGSILVGTFPQTFGTERRREYE